MPLANGTVIGPYEITGWIGAGGMGEVYRANDPRLGREVAIKMISEGYATDAGRVQRFEQEARAAGQLNHPSILAVYDAGVSSGRPFIVSELLEGQSLRDRLRAGALPMRKVIEYARQIADGLAAAHDKAIVHRDLKPDNIFITNDGRIKILDFGLAKLTQPSSDETRTAAGTDTEAGTILGTAGYMSPEQVRGEVVDVRSDLFSFGTILYEMISGSAPFARNTPIESMTAILNHDPMPAIAASVTPAIEKIVARCLEKSRDGRFQSARDLAFGIEFLSGSSLSAVTAPRHARSSWLSPRLAVGALVIGAIIAASIFASRYRATPPAPAAVVRMTIDLGSGALLPMTLAQFGDLAAISPDGTQIAFSAQKAADDKTLQIYLRSLADLQAKPLPGTERGIFPFFSPDGRSIGFFTGSALFKIATSGGPAQKLADITEARGGSWGDDGTILYTPDRLQGTVVWRVSANGGNAAPVTKLAEGENIHVFPQMLPGSKAILYTSSSTPGSYNDSNLIVQSLETGVRKVIHSGGYHGRITKSGHLVFIRDGTLMAAPFDRDRLELLRAPSPAITDVRANTITGGAQFAVSDSGVIAYLPGPTVGGSMPMHVMDRQSVSTPLKGDFGNWLDVRLSPDGGRLAATVRGRQSAIEIFDLARETLTPLHNGGLSVSDVLWSVDGSRVVFAVHDGAKPVYMEWRPADGSGNSQRILNSARNQVPSAFHPSGRYLIYEEFTNPSETDLMMVPVDRSAAAGWRFGEPRALTQSPARESQAAFSPDGRWLAYTSDAGGRPEVFVQPFPELNRRWQISNERGWGAVWSRAKPELLYVRDGELNAVEYSVRAGAFVAEKPQRWSEGRVAFRGPSRMFDLFPDGNRVVLAPAPSPRVVENSSIEKIVLVFNFFDELRRVAPSQ